MAPRRQTCRMPSGSLHYTQRIILYKHRRRRRRAVPHYKGSPSSHKWNFSTGLIYDVPICSTVTKCKSKRRLLHLWCVLCKYVYGSSSAACVSLQEQCDCFREDELFWVKYSGLIQSQLHHHEVSTITYPFNHNLGLPHIQCSIKHQRSSNKSQVAW